MLEATTVKATGTITYYGPTDTSGSRHIIRWTEDGKRKQRTVGYNHAARDAAVDAVAKTFGVRLDDVELKQRGQTTTSTFTALDW